MRLTVFLPHSSLRFWHFIAGSVTTSASTAAHVRRHVAARHFEFNRMDIGTRSHIPR
jgi:hypothetical protein